MNQPLPRTGIGVDVHAFAPEGSDRPMWLAGLHWPGETGLVGHSDADVAARPLRERRGILEEIAADAVPAIVLPPVADDVDPTSTSSSPPSAPASIPSGPSSACSSRATASRPVA